MKLILATAVVVMGQSIPVLAHSRGLFKSALETVIFPDIYEKSPSSIRVPESESLFRRAQQTLSQECTDEIDMRVFDDVYNATRDASYQSCAGANQGWLNENGTVINVADFRSCDTSEYKAFCDANYQSLEYLDFKLTCVETAGFFLYPTEAYIYDVITCSGKSCPSDPVDWSLEDYFAFYPFNSSVCTAEFLQEGEEPPQEPVRLAATLSQECTDEIDIAYDDAMLKNVTDNISDECQNQIKRYKSGNNSIVVYDNRDCDISKLTTFCDAKYQSIDAPNVKFTCPNNNLFYFFPVIDCVGTSCPSDPAAWLIPDVQYLFAGFESCDMEILEEGEDPPPPPNDPTDAQSTAPFAAPSAVPFAAPSAAPSAAPYAAPFAAPSAAPFAASGHPWTITLFTTIATTLAFFF